MSGGSCDQALVVVQQTVKAAHEVDYPLVVFVNQFVHVTLNLVGIVIILYLLHWDYIVRPLNLASFVYPPQRKRYAAHLRDGNTSYGLFVSRQAYRCPAESVTCEDWCSASGTRPDCPSTHLFSFRRAVVDCFHTVDEAVELGDHRLKGLSFDRYDFHIHSSLLLLFLLPQRNI